MEIVPGAIVSLLLRKPSKVNPREYRKHIDSPVMNKGLVTKVNKALPLEQPLLIEHCNYKACLDLFDIISFLDEIPYK